LAVCQNRRAKVPVLLLCVRLPVGSDVVTAFAVRVTPFFVVGRALTQSWTPTRSL